MISPKEGCKHSDEVFKRHNWKTNFELKANSEYTVSTTGTFGDRADFTFKPVNDFILNLRIEAYHADGTLMKSKNPSDLSFF